MSWLERLRERWARGREARPPTDAETELVEDRILTTPDEASQMSTLPDGQREDILGDSQPPGER